MKKIVAILVGVILMVATVSFAEPVRKSGGEIGLEISHIEYEEPDLMKQKGVMYGVAAAYGLHANKIMLKLDGRFAYGQVDYSSPISGTLDDIDDYNVEARIALGYDFPVSEKAIITPYAGFGYRYLNDDMSGMRTNLGARGYERESRYLYTPIGIDMIVSLQDGWSMGLVAEYDLFWAGLQKTHWEDVLANVATMDNDQKDGWGARGSIKIKKKSGNIDFIIEPFLRYWDIDKSETTDIASTSGTIIGYGWEPANTSTEWGVKLGIQF
ncbi:MAG: autotransporter outer membrane beta-barrel domain-containing protein [Candidatus Orphnella occulta]|nr:autotransporter outer membrane beta-barrel domain-containing protein [Candidatus Orphnella occulta]